jgi:hypothetical protein
MIESKAPKGQTGEDGDVGAKRNNKREIIADRRYGKV